MVLSPSELVVIGQNRMENHKYMKARVILERIRNDFPASSEATEAQILIADSFFNQKDYEEAAVEYRLFLDFHPANLKADYALYRLALCRYRRTRGPDRDLTMVHDGVEEFSKLIRLYPDSPLIPQAQEKLEDLKEILLTHDRRVASFYLKTHRWAGAISRYTLILTKTEDPEIVAEANAGIAKAQPHQDEFEKDLAEWEAKRTEKLAKDKEELGEATDDTEEISP